MKGSNCVVTKKENDGVTDFCNKYALLRRIAQLNIQTICWGTGNNISGHRKIYWEHGKQLKKYKLELKTRNSQDDCHHYISVLTLRDATDETQRYVTY